MVSFLVGSMNFLAFVMRLLSEDIIWLKNYFSGLSNWYCIGFFAWCILYISIVKYLSLFAGLLIKWVLSKGINIEFLDSLAFKMSCSNPLYCEGYEEGYTAGINYKEPSWWSKTKLNPFNWFK